MFNVIFIMLNTIFFLYLIMILISFDPSDLGWMQLQSTWKGSICNQGGMIGAQIADFLFFFCGVVAYIIPAIVISYVLFFLKNNNISIFQLHLMTITILILFIIFCFLAQLMINDIFYFSPGGIIGSILCDIIKSSLSIKSNVICILSCISTISVIYFLKNIFLFYLKIIQKKIIYLIHMKYIFCSKKNNQKYQINKQACFNTRISPSVFVSKKNTLFRFPIYNSSDMNKKFSIHPKILRRYKKQFANDFNKNYNQVQFVPSTYNMDIHDKNIIQYSIKNANRTNRMSYFIKKNTDSINNKYISKIRNNNNDNMFATVFQKNTKQRNTSLTHVTCVNDVNFNKQKKTSPIKQLNYQSQSISTINDCNTIVSIQKESQNNSTTNFIFPDINLLFKNSKKHDVNYIKFNKFAQLIEKKLSEYHITATVAKITAGPVITRFDLNLSAGIKSSKITSLSRDLARSLSVTSVRVMEVIPGTPYVGLEIPNEKRDIVYLRDVISSNKFQKNNSPLTLVFGKNVSGQSVIEDLRYMPHLLISGMTGSGKSIGINVLIISILYKSMPEDVRFIMIDPKILELSIYSNIPHLLKDVITDIANVESTLQWCVKEMDRRYKLMSILGVRNLENYNHQIEQWILQNDKLHFIEELLNKEYTNDIICYHRKSKKLPYIVVIIDEFADLIITTTKTVEILITRLTQKARAAGIHIILATQRPSVDVITGVIKANIPARIAFTVSSKIDSRTILGQSGAESLLGMGDMLYLSPNTSLPIRIHGAYVTDTEIHAVVDFWKKQNNLKNI